MSAMNANPIRRTPVAIARPRSSWMRVLLDGPLRVAERALGLDRIEAMASAVEQGDPSVPVMERVLQATGLRPKIAAGELERVPSKGAVVVCSNHPYGGADGTVMLASLLRRRPDVKLLTNGIMAQFPFLAEHCLFVDPFGGGDAARRNAIALRDALAWLKAGHVLACFPAGEVSSSQWGTWQPHDPPWSTIPARLALSAKARVVPAWFDGCNRRVFHAAGLIHPRLRTAMLPNEFVARCGREMEFRIGRPVDVADASMDAESLTRLLRGRSELLRRNAHTTRAAQVLEPIAPPASSGDQLAAELAALSSGALLFREAHYDVFVTRAAAIPRSMHEIGRLREISFRDVGEGSGKSIDLDRFDETYMQIIVWNREAKEIVGAYRAGVVRVVTKDIGTDGLYTSTLFNYSPSMLDALGDAVELGRSFVRPEYQRQPLPLALLWKGIGRFMIAGGHRRMFGPISISNDYQSMSKELIMEFLERHRLAAPFAKLVSPRNPPTRRDIAGWTDRERAEALTDITHVERLIEEIERGQRAVPVLLRQYLRLNAKLLAFNVDADFGEVIDALMLFDMMQIDERILGHYVGEEGMQILRARFGKAQPEHDQRG